MTKPKRARANWHPDHAIAQHLQLELVRLDLKAEHYRLRRERLKLCCAIVIMLTVGSVLWTAPAMEMDLTAIIKRFLVEMLN